MDTHGALIELTRDQVDLLLQGYVLVISPDGTVEVKGTIMDRGPAHQVVMKDEPQT